MGMDSYKIGLGNLDTKTRRNAESNNVSFWNEEAKKLHGSNRGQKLLYGTRHLLNGLSVVRSMHPTTHLMCIKLT